MGFSVEIKVFSIDLQIPRGQRLSFLLLSPCHPVPRWGCWYSPFAWGLCSGEGKKAGGIFDAVEQAGMGGFVHQSAAGLSGAELLKNVQNVLGLFCGLCLSGLYFAWDACLGLSFREENTALLLWSCCFLETIWHLIAFPGALFADVCLSAERQVGKGLRNFTWWTITAGDQKSCVFKTNRRRSAKTCRGFPCLINAASPWG